MKNSKELGLFLTVGLVSAGVNFFSFYLILSLVGASYIVASTIAYILSVVIHFLGNRSFTFRVDHLDLTPQLKKYLVLLAINYCVTIMAVSTTVEICHLSPYLGTIIAIALTVGVGFLLSKRWVFNGKKS